MVMRYCSPAKALMWAALALPLCVWLGCTAGSGGMRERPIALSESNATVNDLSSPKAGPSAPPTGPEIQAAVQRLFGDDVQTEKRPGMRFASGDFNGDASPDLLVVVKPLKNKLLELNSDLANWSVQDPRHTYVPSKKRSVVAAPPVPKPEKVQAGETLLAVIHGYGPAGWRDPMARQAYLLREAAGTDFRVSQPSKKLIHDFGVFPSPREVLSENLEGTRGVLYWTGAAYAWHVEQ